MPPGPSRTCVIIFTLFIYSTSFFTLFTRDFTEAKLDVYLYFVFKSSPAYILQDLNIYTYIYRTLEIYAWNLKLLTLPLPKLKYTIYNKILPLQSLIILTTYKINSWSSPTSLTFQKLKGCTGVFFIYKKTQKGVYFPSLTTPMQLHPLDFPLPRGSWLHCLLIWTVTTKKACTRV